MTLTRTSAVTSEDKVAVSYLNPTYTDLPRIKDEACNPAKEFTDRAVHNNMPSTSNLVRALEQQKSSRNTPATGAPTIIGTPLPGQTLTADTSGIEDEDGLTRVALSYRWLSSDGTTDTDIQGATESTYTLVADDSQRTVASLRVGAGLPGMSPDSKATCGIFRRPPTAITQGALPFL